MHRRRAIPIPWFIRWVAGTVLEESAREADPSADMLLLFYLAGATVLGIIVGFLTGAHLFPDKSDTFGISNVLLASFIGALCCLSLALIIFRFRNLLRWEKTFRRKPSHKGRT